jgi:hypothetical protein
VLVVDTVSSGAAEGLAQTLEQDNHHGRTQLEQASVFDSPGPAGHG